MNILSEYAPFQVFPVYNSPFLPKYTIFLFSAISLTHPAAKSITVSDFLLRFTEYYFLFITNQRLKC